MKRRCGRVKRIGVASVTLLAAVALSGCSGGATSISCNEFLSKSSGEQRTIMDEWTQNEVHVSDVGGVYLDAMISYCQDHPDDPLDRLEINF